MRHADAVARLRRPWPEAFPAPPEALIPVIVPTGTRREFPESDGTPPRPAAVLVLVLPDADGEARVVLTERVDRGGHHSGEVSFPGGSAESQDPDAEATAIREAVEEVGLDPVAIGLTVVGRLESFTIPVSAFLVTPVVAVAERGQPWRLQTTEVARLVEAPVGAFLPGAPIVIVEELIREWPLRYGAYPVDDLLVWGATARILGQLGAMLATD